MTLRYTQVPCDEYPHYFTLEESPDGDWMRYFDVDEYVEKKVRQALAEKDKEIERLKEDRDMYRNFCVFSAERWPQAVAEYRKEHGMDESTHPSQAAMIDWVWARLAAALQRAETAEKKALKLEDAVREALVQAEAEWDSVGRHPASRFAKDVASYRAALNPPQEAAEQSHSRP